MKNFPPVKNGFAKFSHTWCWGLILTSKETYFFPFTSSSCTNLTSCRKKCFVLRKKIKEAVFCSGKLGVWRRERKNGTTQNNNRKLVAFLEELLIGIEERSGFIWIEESPKYLSELLFVMFVWKWKIIFAKLLLNAEAIFSLETLRPSMLLIMFSFFEVKIPPDSAWKFCVDFVQSVSSVSVTVSKSFVSFQQIKSQKQSRR